MSSAIWRRNTDRSTSTRNSDDSQESRSTAPTSIYSSPRPSLQHAQTDSSISSKHAYHTSPTITHYPRSSTETYASTTASQEDLFEEPESYEPEYEVPEYRGVAQSRTNLRYSTPADFAEYFPSSKRLHIRHDDTTYDGNMNLRVDIEVGQGRSKENVQLFHMRMHDLKKREFSIRRYERSSGREVCHSTRKYAKPAAGRPALTKSVSNALASIRGASRPEFKRTNSGFSTQSPSLKHVKRQDSGYGSEEDDDDSSIHNEKKSIQIPTNTTKLEFSNYAQVEVKRRGTKSSKRFEFEYWGHNYAWKRVTEKDGDGKAISYHLFKGDSSRALAHIVPELLSPAQVKAEKAAGGWVPPCSMWISDKSVLEALTDVADVIISTGLIALVDDCIKRRVRARTRHTHHLSLPLTPLKMDMEFVGPKAMVEHIFKRRNSAASTRERELRSSPLRQANPVTAGY